LSSKWNVDTRPIERGRLKGGHLSTTNSNEIFEDGDSGSTKSDRDERRSLLGPEDDHCNSFQFLYAVNGDLTTLDKNDFLERKYQVGKNVELLTSKLFWTTRLTRAARTKMCKSPFEKFSS
jgi:hypothetical protein